MFLETPNVLLAMKLCLAKSCTGCHKEDELHDPIASQMDVTDSPIEYYEIQAGIAVASSPDLLIS